MFCPAHLKEMLDQWNTRCFFRAAYRPGVNGILERHHRAIKAMAKKRKSSPIEGTRTTCHQGLDKLGGKESPAKDCV